MNVLLLEVPWPEASRENSTTLSLFMASAHSRKEEALTFVVSVVRDNCRSWPHRGRVGPQVRKRQVDHHAGPCVLLPKLFLRQIYSFFSMHTSCLRGSCFNESCKEQTWVCSR